MSHIDDQVSEIRMSLQILDSSESQINTSNSMISFVPLSEYCIDVRFNVFL